jgi:hypothetical protein
MGVYMSDANGIFVMIDEVVVNRLLVSAVVPTASKDKTYLHLSCGKVITVNLGFDYVVTKLLDF